MRTATLAPSRKASSLTRLKGQPNSRNLSMRSLAWWFFLTRMAMSDALTPLPSRFVIQRYTSSAISSWYSLLSL